MGAWIQRRDEGRRSAQSLVIGPLLGAFVWIVLGVAIYLVLELST